MSESAYIAKLIPDRDDYDSEEKYLRDVEKGRRELARIKGEIKKLEAAHFALDEALEDINAWFRARGYDYIELLDRSPKKVASILRKGK